MYLLLKFLKILAAAMLFTGTTGAVLARDLEDRRRFAYWLAGPGMGLSWLLGFVLGWSMQLSLFAFWVVAAIFLSLFSLQVVLFSVGREGRRGPLVAALALLPLVACVALMLWKPVLASE